LTLQQQLLHRELATPARFPRSHRLFTHFGDTTTSINTYIHTYVHLRIYPAHKSICFSSKY